MSYSNSIEHSKVITDITCTELHKSYPHTSAGWDELATFVANKCVHGYIEQLTYLIKTSFTEGVFSTELKLDRVVLIFLTGYQTELTNYMPISIISIFVKVSYTHLLDFIMKNQII